MTMTIKGRVTLEAKGIVAGMSNSATERVTLSFKVKDKLESEYPGTSQILGKYIAYRLGIADRADKQLTKEEVESAQIGRAEAALQELERSAGNDAQKIIDFLDGCIDAAAADYNNAIAFERPTSSAPSRY